MNFLKQIAELAIGIAILIGCLALAAHAQEKTKLTVYAGFSNYNVSIHREAEGEPDSESPHQFSIKGFDLEGSYNLIQHKYVRLQATADFATHYAPGGSNNYQFLGGPQIHYDLGRVSPFVRGLFGSTYVYGQHLFTKSAGLGVDIKINKHLFIRPAVVDLQWANAEVEEVYYPIRSTRVGAGLGLRF